MEVGQKKCGRDLSHLEFDVSLYEYMLNQLDISLKSGNPHIDHGYLKNGLQRGQKLELVFASAESNSEVQLSFVLRAILPHKWHDVDLPFDGQESYVVYFNNNKSVSMLRLRENIEHLYITQTLPLLALPPEEIASDQLLFEEDCLKRLLIFSPNSSLEFAVALRSLPSVLREHRPLGLVVVDSINTFSLADYYDLHKESEPPRQSNIVVDPAATSFVIQNKGVNTKKRKGRSFEQALFCKCGDLIKDYWEDNKFPLIVTKVDNTSLSSVENLGNRDLHLKKLEADQILVIADRRSKLYEQLCAYIDFKQDRGIMLISKASEELEYDLLVVTPKDNTLYSELETLEQKKVKLAN